MAFIDAHTLPNATEIEADLIVIGGGLAGLAIAKQWANTGRRVAVLESGGREIDREIQALYAGAGVMRAPGAADRQIDDYLIQSRVRALGGSGNVWGGKCVPLDEADFTRRDWLDRTGWPVTRAEMQPYYDRACDLLQIERFNRDWDASPEPDRPPLRIIDSFFSAPRRFSQVSGWADRARFDAFCGDFVEASPNITIYLHANVTNIVRRGARVRSLEVACLNGHRHTGIGRAYVLATGGIENVRLLLASGGIGNHSELLGRCFMGHVTFGVYENPDGLNTMLCVSDGRDLSLYTNNGRDVTHCVIATTLEGQRRFGTGNFTTTLANPREAPNAEDAAVLTLAATLDANGAGARHQPCFFMSEQLPNLESRITLLPEHTDALGMPRVLLDWVYSERDMANLERSIAALGDALGAEGKGRV
ncbi:MAG TPA: GMC family oxidoreductase, partial [Candidatus Binatia bacterium]|nr:GMC family oxidoreductase [Candidatus Binatia bacterium]